MYPIYINMVSVFSFYLFKDANKNVPKMPKDVKESHSKPKSFENDKCKSPSVFPPKLLYHCFTNYSKKKKSRGEAQSTQCCDATILKCPRYEKEKRLSHAA